MAALSVVSRWSGQGWARPSALRWLQCLLLALFLALQYALWVGEGSLPQLWSLRSSLEQQRAENAELAERNRALEAEVADLREGSDAIEEHARSDLGLIGPGETFYQIIQQQSDGKW